MVSARQLVVLGALLVLACGPKAASPAAPGAAATKPPPGNAAIHRFDLVAAESLRVDKIGLRDGALRPDGMLDLVFYADVDGPLSALHISSVDAKGDATATFRANTLVGNQQPPEELGGMLEQGAFSLSIGVEENGKLINTESGSLGELSPGRHSLKLYVGNSGALREGMRVALFGVAPNGAVVRSQPMTY